MKNPFLTVTDLKPSAHKSKSRLYVEPDGKIRINGEPGLVYIDLFCGAGGVSTGIVRAGGRVLMCINHDPVAIASHEANHPDVIHAVEDITTFDLTELVRMGHHQTMSAAHLPDSDQAAGADRRPSAEGLGLGLA